MNHRSWAEIDLKILASNVQRYQASLSKPHKILAVIKANGYGHGDVEIGTALHKAGIQHFAVAALSEAIKIRENGIEGQILILGYTDASEAEKLIKYDITQTLVSEEHAESMAKTGLPVKCQFAIDTRMNRIGLDVENIDLCESIIRKYFN